MAQVATRTGKFHLQKIEDMVTGFVPERVDLAMAADCVSEFAQDGNAARVINLLRCMSELGDESLHEACMFIMQRHGDRR